MITLRSAFGNLFDCRPLTTGQSNSAILESLRRAPRPLYLSYLVLERVAGQYYCILMDRFRSFALTRFLRIT